MKDIFGVVQREGQEKAWWTKIGVAFENKDGSLNLKLDFFPTSGETTIQIREQRPREVDSEPETKFQVPSQKRAAAAKIR